MIITFYSFKGGVGRSHSLVEVAARLAREGRRVCVWDLDLEAPGVQNMRSLDRLRDALADAASKNHHPSGTLDLLLALQTGKLAGNGKSPGEAYNVAEQKDHAGRVTYPKLDAALEKAIVTPSWPGMRDGYLHFLLPGQFPEGYSEKFSEVKWELLWENEPSPGWGFFNLVARRLREAPDLAYDVVLIDARTGFTPLGAVSAIQIPDLTVVVFNLNRQNQQGVRQVVERLKEGKIQTLLVANFVPLDADPRLLAEREKELEDGGLGGAIRVPLCPELLLTEAVFALAEDPQTDATARQRNAAYDELFARIRGALDRNIEETEREHRGQIERTLREGDPVELERLRRLGIYEKAKRFEERVAELYRLAGFQADVDQTIGQDQFDVVIEQSSGPLGTQYGLVECKDRTSPVARTEIREFADKVAAAVDVKRRPYRAIVVSRGGFATNSRDEAERRMVQLLTYEQLMRSLVDFERSDRAAIEGFVGTPLERHYVENTLVFEDEIRPGEPLETRPVREAVQEWLDRPGQPILTLLGDFGVGKSSFCRVLAAELAQAHRERPDAVRAPVLVDLAKAGSTTMSLENVLADHFQRIGSPGINTRALLELNREGQLLILFDGFDETIAYAEADRHHANLKELLRAAEGRAKILLTCRTHYFRDRPESLKQLGVAPEMATVTGATSLYEELRSREGARVAFLREFDDAQIDAYLQKAVAPPADWRSFKDQIDTIYDLKNLSTRPFLLELVVQTLPRLERSDDVSLAALYEAYGQKWFERNERQLRQSRDLKIDLVEHLALLVWGNQESRVHYDELWKRAVSFFEGRGVTLRGVDREAIDYEVRTALFLTRSAEGFYRFAHRSFLEFFLARGFARAIQGCDRSGPVPEEVVAWLDTRLFTDEVAFFLSFFPAFEALPWLVRDLLGRPYRRRVSENALLLARYHTWKPLRPPLSGEGYEDGELEQARRRFEEFELGPVDLGGADFGGRDLSGTVATRWNLDGASLRGCTLVGVKWTGCTLREADLEGAALDRATLRKVVASGSRWPEGRLLQTTLEDVDLHGADFYRLTAEGLRLTNTDFSGCDLRLATMADVAGDVVSFRDANTTRMILRSARMTSLDVEGAVLDGCLWDLDAAAVRGTPRMARALRSARPLPSSLLCHPLRTRKENAPRLRPGFGSTALSSVAWHPNGRVVASAEDDGTVRIWDGASGRETTTLKGHDGLVLSVSWHPDGSALASGGADGTVRIWDAASGRETATLKAHGSWVQSVSWHPDGSALASGGLDGTVRIWDAPSGRETATLEGHDRWVRSVSWHPDGGALASVGDDGTVRIWDAASGRETATLRGHDGSLLSVNWRPDGSALASGGDDGTVRIWDAASGRETATLRGHDGSLLSVSWHPDGSALASGGTDGTVRIWDAASGRETATLKAHGSWVQSVSWHPDGSALASGGLDGTVRIWDAESGRETATLKGHDNRVRSVSWHPDGSALAAGGGDGTVRIWDAATGHETATLKGHDDRVRSVSWHPNGSALAAGGDDGTVRIWDAATGRETATLKGHDDRVRSVSWHPNGSALASGGEDGTVRIWDAATGWETATLKGHDNWVRSVSWHPDGSALASGGVDGTVRIWDAASGRETAILKGHHGWVLSVSWHPDGSALASGGSDGTVRIWDAASGRETATLKGHDNWVESVSWRPDGNALASTGDDGTVRIWDAGNGRETVTLKGHDGSVLSVSWHPDGSALASGGNDGTVRLWDAASERCRRVTFVWHGGFATAVERALTALEGLAEDSPLEWIRGGQGWPLWMLDLPTYAHLWPGVPLVIDR